MKSFSSSEGEGDDITINLRENPTPLPHSSPQHAKPQQSLRPSSQNAAPPQTLIEGASPALPSRKLSTPFYSGSGAVTPVDSPSIARRPLIYTQHTQGKKLRDKGFFCEFNSCGCCYHESFLCIVLAMQSMKSVKSCFLTDL